MSRLSLLLASVSLLAQLVGCDQLGNPKQYATGPTVWRGPHGHLVTATRSFRGEKTIRRMVAEGLEGLDHVDPSIGPDQTLTFVSVVARALRAQRTRTVELVTVFEMPDRRPVARRWKASADSRHWGAAFAMPAPPTDAVTSLAP